MRSLFKNRFLISFLKVIACVLLIGVSHNVFLWQNTLPDGYEAVSFVWLYFGVPLCLIMILTGGKPAATWTGFWSFVGKLGISLTGIFILLIVYMFAFFSMKLYGDGTEETTLWIWNSYYYILLLLIWQPQVFKKDFNWLKYPVLLFFIFFVFFPLTMVVMMRIYMSLEDPVLPEVQAVSEIQADIGAGE